MTNTLTQQEEYYFKKIYDDYKPLVIFIASLYLDNTDYVDDVIQEVFLEVFAHNTKISDYKSYVAALAKNKAISINKATTAIKLIESIDDFVISNLKGKSEFIPVIDELSSVLSTKEINIILLHLYGGYSFKEISEYIHVNEKTVKTTYYRSIKKCRKEFL